MKYIKLQCDFLMTYLASFTTVHPKVYSRRPFPTDSTKGECKGLRIRDVFFSFLGLRFGEFEAIGLRRAVVWFKHVCKPDANKVVYIEFINMRRSGGGDT